MEGQENKPVEGATIDTANTGADVAPTAPAPEVAENVAPSTDQQAPE